LAKHFYLFCRKYKIKNLSILKDPVVAQNNCRLFWVFGSDKSTIKESLVNFWLENNAITDASEAWRRTDEVACIILDDQNDIIAVSSVYINRLDSHIKNFWLYRTFVRPKDRKHFFINKIPLILIVNTYEHLARLPKSPDSPAGLMFFVDNIKFNKPGSVNIIRGIGFSKIVIPNALKVAWVRYF
jgi:hypothetical protein